VLAVFVRTLMTLSHHQYADIAPGRDDEAPDLLRTMHDHERLVEAIVAGDGALARHRMLRHLQATAYATPEPRPVGDA
jgi:DNA-binding GntR family transcriptional regulator